MSLLYSLAQPFVWHPGRAAAVALACCVMLFVLPRPARGPLLVVAVSWGVFALLELEAWRARADIRVDLLFTWPALCILTLVAFVVCLRRILSQDSPRREETDHSAP